MQLHHVHLKHSSIQMKYLPLAVPMMNAYFCPHLMFTYGYLIEFVCLKIDLIEISYNLVY